MLRPFLIFKILLAKAKPQESDFALFNLTLSAQKNSKEDACLNY
ncbi:hypothetical protein DESAMIL20_1121 [Desulfurella amilsii]|uniref:Uncharacterized protein n=1 Tax=Desulfurella amilsii TaxID=1562698 RepID=A0A1X4XVN1_9BACT|nr:hypothetical protein DESAMIL20_1121 [Desulfurella amilsii]